MWCLEGCVSWEQHLVCVQGWARGYGGKERKNFEQKINLEGHRSQDLLPWRFSVYKIPGALEISVQMGGITWQKHVISIWGKGWGHQWAGCFSMGLSLSLVREVPQSLVVALPKLSPVELSPADHYLATVSVSQFHWSQRLPSCMEWGTVSPGNIFGADIQPHPKPLYKNKGENLTSCKNQFKCLQRNSKAWHCRLIFTRWVTETVDPMANLWAKARWQLLLAWEWPPTCFLEPWRQSELRVAFSHLEVRLPLQGERSQLRDAGLAATPRFVSFTD